MIPEPLGPVRYRRALEGLLGVPATEGNQVDVLRNGDHIFPAIFDAIESATSTIDFLTFVYWRGSVGEEMAELLAAKAAAGLRVRVILDAIGAFSMDRALVADGRGRSRGGVVPSGEQGQVLGGQRP